MSETTTLAEGAPARYRKKPVVIEATQWQPGLAVEGVEDVLHEEGHRARIKTLEGYHGVNPGDYIITGVRGERYPCREDIFLETYERVS